jgi:hypothetical protein
MKITDTPRDIAARRQDVLDRLERETDIWVASAGADGAPCLVPLWFAWDGTDVWLATRPGNPTGRNLRAGGRTRLAFADTRDVVLIDGEAKTFTAADVPVAAAERFDAYFRVRPVAVQAWHEVRELPQRHIMRDGVWLG